MIVKDVEDGLSNFPEDVDIYFACDGKQMFLQGIECRANTAGIAGMPDQVILMRFTDGTVQGEE